MTTKTRVSRFFGFDVPPEWVGFYDRERKRELRADQRLQYLRANYRPAQKDIALVEHVNEALVRLPVSQFLVVTEWMYCGRISEVGRRLGVSKQRASVVFIAALERLRELLTD